MNPLLVRTLRKESVERPPVWLMRQAGRYLVEYQELKSRHTFLELCKSPELALEVTMQPMRIFNPDAAILFADILLPAEALGIHVDFAPGPKVANPLQSRADIEALRPKDPVTTLPYVMAAVKSIKRELEIMADGGVRKALLGFAGAPWTMACYLLDQGPYKHFAATQVFAYEHPKALEHLLNILTDVTIDYLLAQIEHGADAVQIFDSWGGLLSLADYRRFSLPYLQRIVAALQKAGAPVILYVNGSAHLFEGMVESGATCLSVDWRTPLSQAQEFAGDSSIIQGNLDPSHLFGSAEEVTIRTKKMLQSLHRQSGYIANLGHGVLQRTPRENVKAFVDTVKAGWQS